MGKNCACFDCDAPSDENKIIERASARTNAYKNETISSLPTLQLWWVQWNERGGNKRMASRLASDEIGIYIYIYEMRYLRCNQHHRCACKNMKISNHRRCEDVWVHVCVCVCARGCLDSNEARVAAIPFFSPRFRYKFKYNRTSLCDYYFLVAVFFFSFQITFSRRIFSVVVAYVVVVVVICCCHRSSIHAKMVKRWVHLRPYVLTSLRVFIQDRVPLYVLIKSGKL